MLFPRILGRIHDKACEVGMPLHYQDEEIGLPIAGCVTWVDDLAFSVCATAEQVVDKAVHMFSIIQDAMLEHGTVLTSGVGKTAAIFAFHGEGATKARQDFERAAGGGLHIMSEHVGCMTIYLWFLMTSTWEGTSQGLVVVCRKSRSEGPTPWRSSSLCKKS